MKQNKSIQLFEDKMVRTLWDTDQEKWLISIIDVIEILTNTDRPRKYWSDLKTKLKKEGSQLSEKNRTTENAISRWKILSYRCSRYRTAFQTYSIYSIAKSRT